MVVGRVDSIIYEILISCYWNFKIHGTSIFLIFQYLNIIHTYIQTLTF